MALAVPSVIIPASYNSTLIKLLLFTVCAGLLLVVLGLKVIRGFPLHWSQFFPLVLLAPAITLLHRYAPSNPGVERILLVCSATGIFISIRAFCLDKRKILIPVIIGGILAIILSIILPSSSERTAGLFSNANLLGSFAAGLLPVGAAFLFGRSLKRHVLLVLFLVPAFTAIYMSGTRSSVLAIVAAIPVVFIIRWKPGLLWLLYGFFLLAVAVVVAMPGLPVPEFGGTAGVRQVIWEGSSQMFMEKPVLGWGNGSFQSVFPVFRASDFASRCVSSNTVHAHSEPLEILAENGIAGFAVWSVLIFLLLKKATQRRENGLMEWGIITGVVVLLLESLASVALRWTTSVYLLAMLLSLLPAENNRCKINLPRWTAVLPLTAGFLLLLPGAFSAYRMTRASICLNSALETLARGGNAEEIRKHCRESIVFNSWELGSWYTLGNTYGLEAVLATYPGAAADLTRQQLAAYDSLSARAPDFALMRVNRITAFLKLGMFDRAMDDILYTCTHREEMRDFCFSTGSRIAPFSSSSRSFELMNLLYSDVLVSNIRSSSVDSIASRRIDLMKLSILTNFALAEIHSPGSVGRMMQSTDSILGECTDSLRTGMLSSIERELAVAEEGYQLFQRHRSGDYEGVEDQCLRVVAGGETYGTYHRAVLCLNAAHLGNPEYLEMAADYSSLLANQCRELTPYYPGAGEILLAAAELSACVGGPEHQSRVHTYLGYALIIDAFGEGVANCMADCYENQPPLETLDFWVANGGPRSSVARFSAESLLIPMGQTAKILQVSGTESPEFKASICFLLGSTAITSPYADSDFIYAQTLLELDGQEDALGEIYGEDEAERVINRIMNSEIEYLETVQYDAASASAARRIKSAFGEEDMQR